VAPEYAYAGFDGLIYSSQEQARVLSAHRLVCPDSTITTSVGVIVGVIVGVSVGVPVFVAVAVPVSVEVAVCVSSGVPVCVAVGVSVIVKVFPGVAVLAGADGAAGSFLVQDEKTNINKTDKTTIFSFNTPD